MAFVVLKSYDGGKRWERGPEYNDFASAANAALALGAKETAIRYRVEGGGAVAQGGTQEGAFETSPAVARRRLLLMVVLPL